MSRYYFNVNDGANLLDDHGAELPDLAAARGEAVRLAGEVLKEGSIGELWNGTPWRMTVTDGPNETGKVLFVLHFSATER